MNSRIPKPSSRITHPPSYSCVPDVSTMSRAAEVVDTSQVQVEETESHAPRGRVAFVGFRKKILGSAYSRMPK